MNKFLKRPKTQAGLILVVVLLIIPVMFLLSYTSISKLTVGERITTNVVERNYAFNAAESALEDSMAWMSSGEQPFVRSFDLTAFTPDGGDYKGLYSDATLSIDEALENNDVIQLGTYSESDVTQSTSPESVGSGNLGFSTFWISNVLSRNIQPDPPDASESQIPMPDKKPVFIVQYIRSVQCVPPVEKTTVDFKITSRGWGFDETTKVTLAAYVSLEFNCKGSGSEGDTTKI